MQERTLQDVQSLIQVRGDSILQSAILTIFNKKKLKNHIPEKYIEKMASKGIFLLVIVVAATRVNAMPIEKLPESPLIDLYGEIPVELPHPEVTTSNVDEDRVKIEKSSLVEKRSIDDDDAKIISNNNIDEDSDDDDLETAAGTNVLRPLFVYRQQLAYRERVRKAGRRAAPNF